MSSTCPYRQSLRFEWYRARKQNNHSIKKSNRYLISPPKFQAENSMASDPSLHRYQMTASKSGRDGHIVGQSGKLATRSPIVDPLRPPMAAPGGADHDAVHHRLGPEHFGKAVVRTCRTGGNEYMRRYSCRPSKHGQPPVAVTTVTAMVPGRGEWPASSFLVSPPPGAGRGRRKESRPYAIRVRDSHRCAASW